MSGGPPIGRALIGAAFVVFIFTSNAYAVCGSDGQGPCYRFWNVDAVFVAKVLDMVPLRAGTDPGLPPGAVFIADNSRLQVRVVEAFRGVTAGDVLTLFAPTGECVGVYAEDGGEIFVYASRNKEGELWAQGCGVSKPLDEAEADIAYARSVSEVGPSALIYGDVFQFEDRSGGPEDFSAMVGVRVRVHGRDFEAETLTDRDGNYSIPLPGSGSYRVEVSPPSGFADHLGGGTVRFEIGDRRSCFNVPFQLRRNGRIRGRVIDREGQPVANLAVRAADSHRRQRFARTDASGRFDIGPLGPGLYSLAARTGAREVEFDTSKLVRVSLGKTTRLSPITAAADDLVLLSIDVTGPGADEALVLLTSSAGGELGDPVPTGPGPIRFLVERDQSFEIIAATMTHSGKAVVRSSEPVTEITLTLHPSPQ